MRYHFLLILIVTLLTSTGCKENELDAKIKALVEQTKKNMVFVQGGSFMMGDPGTEVTDEYGNKERLQITPDSDDNYVHEVTLDSFFINKFETTYAEFDVFSEANKKPKWREGKHTRKPDFPTSTPNWIAAKDYCQWLAKITGTSFLTYPPRLNGNTPPEAEAKIYGMQQIPANWTSAVILSLKTILISILLAHTLPIL